MLIITTFFDVMVRCDFFCLLKENKKGSGKWVVLLNVVDVDVIRWRYIGGCSCRVVPG